MIRALIADDSQTARALLGALLASDPEVEIVAEARDGNEAVELTTLHRPDVVTMDIQMPGMGGFEATGRIMRAQPTPIVICSSLDVRDVTVSLEALRAGALAVLPKPGAGSAQFEQESRHFVATVKAMSRVRIVRRDKGSAIPLVAERAPLPRPAPAPRVVGITASTGGPAALHQILRSLPADFPLPILLVQHIAIGFAEGLAQWLNGASKLQVQVARAGARATPGTVWVAPDNQHLGIDASGRLLLSDEGPIGGFRPSGTYLFQSIAQAFGGASLGVVLTGMGRDGTDGLRALRQAGGVVIAQDEATSDVFGMPRAVITQGLADHVLPLGAIANHLTELV